MKLKFIVLVTFFYLGAAAHCFAQDLGPQFKKVSEGIYVYAAMLNEANSTIILTQDGVVLIDTGQSPKDSHVVMAAVKKLTSQPVRIVIHTEPHPDHAMGDFVFSPPAVVIAHAGATASMRGTPLNRNVLRNKWRHRRKCARRSKVFDWSRQISNITTERLSISASEPWSFTI